MAILPKLRLPRGLNAALFPLVLWACSSGGGADDDSKQPIDGSKGGSASMSPDAAGAPGSGGSDGEPDDMGGGNTGSVGEGGDPPDDMPSGGKAGQGNDDPTPSDSAGAAGETSGGDPEPDPDPEPSEAFLRGKALTELNQCVTCHQANFAGFTVFPNITPDVETGIGSWTDEQIVAALREGKDVDGSSLCSTMQRYPFTDDEAADVVAFLRGLPAVSNAITLDCL
jgi:mono/diheme cytochrome c family protein